MIPYIRRLVFSKAVLEQSPIMAIKDMAGAQMNHIHLCLNCLRIEGGIPYSTIGLLGIMHLQKQPY